MDPICINTLTIPKTKLTSIHFCSDGVNFVTAGADKKMHLHQLGNDKYRCIQYECESSPLLCVASSPSDKFIFGGDKNGKVTVTKQSVRSEKSVFRAHPSAVNSIHFSNDGKRFVTSSNDGVAKIWGYPKCNFLKSFKDHKDWMTSCEFSPDGNVIVTSSNDKTVRIWDVNTQDPPRVFGPFPSAVTKATFHPLGTIIGVAIADGSFFIIDVRNEQTIQCYTGAHAGPVTSIQFHPSGSFALTSSTDMKLCIWDLIEGQLFYTIESHKAEILDAKWNNDGSKFISCDSSGTIKIFQTNFDKLIKTIETTKETDLYESKLSEAMGIITPDPRKASFKSEGSPKKSTEKKNPTPEEMPQIIESSLEKLMNQISFLTKSTAILSQRLEMQAQKLEKLQKSNC